MRSNDRVRRQPPTAAPRKPELVIGLVGATGTDLGEAGKAVEVSLVAYGYETKFVRLSTLMQDIEGGAALADAAEEDKRVWSHMDAGDEIRKQAGQDDAVSGLGVGYI